MTRYVFVTICDQESPDVTSCIMRERSDRSFGCERSEPSWQDRAPRSEAQRSAVQLLVNYAMDAFAASDAMELSVTSANSMYKLTKGVVEEVV